MKHWYNDGKKDFMLDENSKLASELTLGRLKGIGVSTLGKHWYNNGIIQGNFKDGEQPSGWIKGTLGNSTLGYRTYNNGIENKVFSPDDVVPSEYLPGRLKSSNKGYAKGASVRRKIYYNNGIDEIRLLMSDSPPSGYISGRLPKKSIKDKIEDRDKDFLSKGYIPIKKLSRQQLSAYVYYKYNTNIISDVIFKQDVYTYINIKYLELFDDYIKINHSKGTSNKENDLLNYIKSIYKGTVISHSRDIIRDNSNNYYELDIYIPDKNIAIEFNGTYWHSSLNVDKNYHFNKSKMCERIGIRLIHIYEYEWDNYLTRLKLESMLSIALGVFNSRIYARDCEIRLIDNNIAKEFNNINHLQGHRNAQITYGLYYNNNLVQLMSFSKTRYNRNLKNGNSWEIIRGCPGSNNIVVGGVSKLFKHFVRDNSPSEVFSYCDFNKFDGAGYIALGMTFVGYTGPDMHWLLNNREVVNRQPSRHAEYKNMSMARIYGSGSKKYLWKN